MKQSPNKTKIVVLGGGTGTYTVLSGLKKQEADLSAIVSIADDGGSTGRLRDDLGVLPPGDIRQCLAALSDGDDVLRHLLNYRFTKGELAGHNFGNIFISALEMMYGSAESAIKMAHKILRVTGRVIPVSVQPSRLFAELVDGRVVEGEHAIDVPLEKRAPIRECFLDPSVMANPEAIEAIWEADIVVLGPGDLYTSLVPVLLVRGIADAIHKSQAVKVFILNLVNKPGQTDGYLASDYVAKVESYLYPAKIDKVFLNNSPVPEVIASKYTRAGETLVQDDLGDSPKCVRADLLSNRIARPVCGDRLARSLMRHDSEKLAQKIMEARKEKR